MAAIVVIPARFASTRFAGKMIAAETGMPLVQHVVKRAKSCRRVRDVIVAADDERIVAALRPFKTHCVMTSPNHPSGTDRLAEVARDLKDEIIVNVQGDEPEIEPETIDGLIERMEHSDCDMATAATAFGADADVNDPNQVKVVTTLEGRALYFSRSAVPFWRDSSAGSAPAYYLHVGIYAYRRPFLLQFAAWPPSPCESAEKLEQLRALEHGKWIEVLHVARAAGGIDTPAQYAAFVKRYNKEKTQNGRERK